ncbi:hypothetical protein AGMMS49936_01570 [Endomicrobiia bacterium]|nr:hypothetical protein AGMMS49936_01570 [Endomicrobiia bacterium]
MTTRTLKSKTYDFVPIKSNQVIILSLTIAFYTYNINLDLSKTIAKSLPTHLRVFSIRHYFYSKMPKYKAVAINTKNMQKHIDL